MFLRLSYFIEIQLVCEANAEVAKCSKYFTVTSLVALSVIAQYGIKKILDFHTNYSVTFVFYFLWLKT